jgi:YggT family protein
MIAAVIYAVGGFIEILIGLRFLLRLLGANPASGFVQWVYDWSTPFVTPFAGIFGQDATVTGAGVVTTSVFDWTALIALLVIGLAVALIGRLFVRTAPIV